VLDVSSGPLDEVKAALDEYQRAGYALGVTAHFVLLCPTLLSRNETEAALEVIEHGLSVVSHNNERLFEAELYRLEARALLTRGAPDAEVEALIDQALRTARSQQARSLELRAATDLARLWIKQDKRPAAREILAAVYGWFSEGFDTHDLKEARSLLAQLAVP
jgi:predicted ATPase